MLDANRSTAPPIFQGEAGRGGFRFRLADGLSFISVFRLDGVFACSELSKLLADGEDLAVEPETDRQQQQQAPYNPCAQ